MTQEKPYRLVPVSLPAPKTRHGIYEQMLADFVRSGVDSALVECQGKSANTLYQGLYQAVRSRAAGDILVRRREGAVYLARR